MVVYLRAPQVMVACDRHAKNGKAACERKGVALERYARADRKAVPRDPVSIEPAPPARRAIEAVSH